MIMAQSQRKWWVLGGFVAGIKKLWFMAKKDSPN
jgi:hypothetical protein